MIDVKYIHLTCIVCNQEFKNAEEVVTIAARVFDKNNFTFNLLSGQDNSVLFQNKLIQYVGIESVTDIVPREKNFHLKCFEEIAGKDFLP